MTVSTTNSTQSFAGTQSTLTFTFRADPNHPEDIKVIERVTATGFETALTYSSQYTVSINTNGIGGVVTVSPTFSAAFTQIVYRDTALEQDSDYDDYNQFPADTLENDLDRLIMIAQEHEDQLNDKSDKVTSWVRFDGTGAGPITPAATYNISSSVTKVGTGSYIAFFLPTYSSANYAVILGGNALVAVATSVGTNNVSISTTNLSGTATDYSNISVAVFRN